MAVFAASLSGCPQGESVSSDALLDQASACAVTVGDAQIQRTVEIGRGAGDQFTPYESRDDAKLHLGNQGLVMIAPTIRIQAFSGDGDEACFQVRVVNDYQGAFPSPADPTDSSFFHVHFVREGDAFVSDGAIYDALTHDMASLDGLDVLVTATVKGPDSGGEQTLHLTFRE
ncbi:MAG: hypothetical protein U0441_26580 [Polyangiaceae bacterium]